MTTSAPIDGSSKVPVDENDPDHIAANPPPKALDPKQYFQTGSHAGQWMEYDERGVPTKTIKKKKVAKKVKDGLDAEYLEARKKYQQYLKDVEDWEQRVTDAENALEQSDKIRWAFRKLGSDKNSSIAVDDLDELFRIMNWNFPKKEVSMLKKNTQDLLDASDLIALDALRTFTAERMPVLLIEERLGAGSLVDLNVEDIYSPRTWRGKLSEYDVQVTGKKEKEKKEKKTKKDDAMSPRGTRKKTQNADDIKAPSGSKSPRGGSSPRGGGERTAGRKATAPKSPRSKKDK